MNPPSPLCAVYFSTEKYKYDPSRKQTEVSASQTSQQGSLLLIAERKSQPGRSAHAALDAEEGGKERGRQGGGKWKRGFFSASDRSCSQMGGTGPTEGRLHQWRIEQAAAGGEARFVGILICALQKLLRCLHFWSMWTSTSAQRLLKWDQNSNRVPCEKFRYTFCHPDLECATAPKDKKNHDGSSCIWVVKFAKNSHKSFNATEFCIKYCSPSPRENSKVLWHILVSITGECMCGLLFWSNEGNQVVVEQKYCESSLTNFCHNPRRWGLKHSWGSCCQLSLRSKVTREE